MADGGRLDQFALNPTKALEATRHLVLLDISNRLLKLEQEVDYCDAECDRALAEVRRLLRWVDGRLSRNGAFQTA